MPSPFPCNPVICECSWKKTQIEKNIYVQINEETRVAMDSIRLDMIIVAIYCYLEKEIYRDLKCHSKSSSYFEIRASLF